MHIWDWGAVGVVCGAIAEVDAGSVLPRYDRDAEYPEGTCEECLDKAALLDLAETDLLGEEDLQAAYHNNGGSISVTAGSGGASGNGGTVTLTGGFGGTSGNGGPVTIKAGTGKLP